MRKFFLLFVAFALSIGLWATTQTVTYRYPVYNTPGDPASGIASWGTNSVFATEVEDTTTTLSAGWYVVTGINVQTGTLTCTGAVNLILADGAKLTATGGNNHAGITVSGYGNSLIIYAQSTDTAQMGTLIANGGDQGAGIGSVAAPSSNITINGGSVTANGGDYGAGIGGGYWSHGSNITINGGTVTANGGKNSAGIGGGHGGFGVDIIINGGTVTATGADVGAGIGGGREGDCSGITINGGTVTATGADYGAGIGGGTRGDCSDIAINGGTVTANGGFYAAGIGGGDEGSCLDITINGGSVSATGAYSAAGIGGGHGADGSDITIYGGTVTAYGGYQGAGIGGGQNGDGSDITVDGGTVTANGGYKGAGIGGGQNGNGLDINIISGTVTANGGGLSCGIGGGYQGDGSDIYVATTLLVKADGNNPPTTVVTNTGSDLAYSLSGKLYVKIGIPAIISANVNDETMGSVTGAGEYLIGDQVSLTAIPTAHYHFVDWDNGSTDNPLIFVVYRDSAVTASFAIDQHNVTVNVNDPDGGRAIGTGLYNYGDTVMLKATANEHYSLSGWSNGETDTVIYLIVSGDTVITANFAINQHEVTTAVTDTALGSVTGAGTYDYGATVTLTAIPVAHAEFTGWSNGETANPLNITLTSDTTVTANFIFRSSVDDAEADSYVAYAGYNEIVVTGAADHTVAVYDTNGRLVKAIENAADIERINVNVAGVYVIRVSNMTATRVVVK